MALTQVSTEGIKNGTITGSDLATNVDLVDNQKIRFGTGNDLEIFHDGTVNRFISSGTGAISFQSGGGNFLFRKGTSEALLKLIPNGAVELYFDNSKKLETTSGGVQVTDNLNMSGGHIFLADNYKLNVGTGDDLQIYHNGNNSFIENSTGNLHIKGKAGEESIVAIPDGGVELYFNNVKQFETISTGFKSIAAGQRRITIGSTDASGAMLVLDGDSNGDGSGNDYAFIQHNTDGEIQIENYKSAAIRFATAGIDRYKIDASGHFLPAADSTYNIGSNSVRVANGYFDTLYGDGSNLTGVTSVGGNNSVSFNDNVRAKFGNGNDLEIYHDGSHSYINDNGSGNLYISVSSKLHIQNQAQTETLAMFQENSSCELYHDNTLKFETQSYGIDLKDQMIQDCTGINSGGNQMRMVVPTGTSGGFRVLVHFQDGNLAFTDSIANFYSTGIEFTKDVTAARDINPYANNAYDLGTTSLRWRNIYTNDLNLSNEGGANDVDGTWGSYTIQEGSESLYLINKRNGKKYKFNLTEVS